MKIASEQTGLQALGPPPTKVVRDQSESLEVKKQRLRKATKEFESFFILDMLKAMRKTIPKSEMSDGGLGQDVYTSMFDEELARSVAGSGANGLGEMLYKSLEKHLETIERGAIDRSRPREDIPTSIEKIDRIEVRKLVPSGPKIEKPVPVTETIAINEPPSSNVAVDRPSLAAEVQTRPKITADPILREYGPTIDRASREYDVDARLIYSVILAESGGRPDAVSSKGAKGLMQLVDSTAADMGVADSLDPHQNIAGGTKYLRQLLDQFDGSVKLALAAYNAGPGTVSKYNGVPPYPETRQYIENVLGRLNSSKKP